MTDTSPLSPTHPAAHPFDAYTAEILSFRMQSPCAELPEAPDDDTAARNILACLRAIRPQRHSTLLVLGIGSGRLVTELDAALPQGIAIVVSETSPERLRAVRATGRLDSLAARGRTHILADTSPWAHLVLWALCGLTPDNTALRINPEDRSDDRRNELSRLFHSASSLSLGAGVAEAPSIGLAAILSPEDSGLRGFFRHLPPWLSEVVAVWDADEPPARDYPCDVPVRHVARRLGNDFAAQRNAMLAACTTDWVLSLDADERLTATGWDAVRLLAAAGQTNDIGGYFFTRRTLYPDTSAFLAGYGLWPDLQLRLYRRTEDLSYERPIHERLTCIEGKLGIVLDAPILHLSRILKDDAQLRRKLDVFDAAGNGSVRHMLNDDYPRVPCPLLPDAAQARDVRVLTLAHPPA
ncbi:hypothetical protein GGQ74_001239 [Desulfobaculum xiamenense]|uniref:Glycosyl transferase family 2 n=1 Tax=Desulfobaculum xiamenense TaxID=995050 RepID=A0A846QSG2_9BACT|nr:glycosyl transferase family 2 [Desulfobaculum xiamenense]NJB67599.1 hypothetical protein [Desulfobaculum xiamenense]